MKEKSDEYESFTSKLFASVEDRRCADENIIFLKKNPDLEDEDDKFVTPESFESSGGALSDFVYNVLPVVNLDKKNVADVNTDTFEKQKGIIEDLNGIIRDNEEARQKERQEFEEILNKQNEESRKNHESLSKKIEELQSGVLNYKLTYNSAAAANCRTSPTFV